MTSEVPACGAVYEHSAPRRAQNQNKTYEKYCAWRSKVAQEVDPATKQTPFLVSLTFPLHTNYRSASYHLPFRFITLTVPLHITYRSASYHLPFRFITLTIPLHNTYGFASYHDFASYHLPFCFISLTFLLHITYRSASYHLPFRFISLTLSASTTSRMDAAASFERPWTCV